MALEIKGMPRVFQYDDKELPEINPDLTAKEIMEVYSNTYPELNNAKLLGPEIKDGKQVFKFSAVLGTKG